MINEADSQVKTSEFKTDTTYTLLNDTLFSNASYSIYKGQKLVIGNGTYENGCYKTIGFKSYLSWPLLLNYNLDMKYNTEYQNDSQKRDLDKVKESLIPGDTLIVTEIKKKKDRRIGIWYHVNLKTTKFPQVHFRSNIEEAIRTKEIMIAAL